MARMHMRAAAARPDMGFCDTSPWQRGSGGTVALQHRSDGKIRRGINLDCENDLFDVEHQSFSRAQVAMARTKKDMD